MKTPYFDITVPLLIKNVTILKALIEKGFAHSKAVGMTEIDFLDSKLAPDMFPLSKQIQIVTDNAKSIPARLTGNTPIVLPDTEQTVMELCMRIDVVLNHLATYTAEQFTDASDRKIVMPYYEGKYILGHDYLVEFALANFFFHMNMTYALLRFIGTPLGKADYIGGMTMQQLT